MLNSVTIQNCLILSNVTIGDKSKIKDAKIPMSQEIEEKSNITGETGE
jgi:ADP-glucose pyrophosphorylase